nr:lipase 2 [Quercus suber]
MILLHRTALRRRIYIRPFAVTRTSHEAFHQSPRLLEQQTAHKTQAEQKTAETRDPRLGRVLFNDFADLRDQYQAPTHPIILAHGLLGFDELHLAGRFLPGIQYWYGIRQALAAKGIEVITAEVPPSGSIEKRAQRLAEVIERKAEGRAVNIIAHSMVCSDCPGKMNGKDLGVAALCCSNKGRRFRGMFGLPRRSRQFMRAADLTCCAFPQRLGLSIHALSAETAQRRGLVAHDGGLATSRERIRRLSLQADRSH